MMNMKREGLRIFLNWRDVDVGDGGDDFVSEELVVEGEPEPLEADLLLEDDSDVEIIV